jgi:uncharacterized protein with gpF-like domain
MSADWQDLPFNEAIDYFRNKVDLPTQRWTDLMGGMHAPAFVVAGANKAELLADLRGAVDKSIAKGGTIQDFRKDFNATVNKTGWTYKGEYGWRTGVIFNTNLSVAYSAGRYKQMTDPDVLAAMPYWRYKTMRDTRVRPLHRQWDGVTLKYDDPWWQSHFPPCGWG